ncbi:hypothetical protein ACFWQG_13255 [Rhodococcus sp. NPDC058532]|uniref:hypothetical protein n=1 Tax=Rhodococcus sp. NPDC058532 TaxID=3346540 RepID=UPI0036541E01
MKGSRRHHPWRHARDHHPAIEIITNCRLPDEEAGFWDGGGRIFLDRDLTQRSRRSALAHECAHVERGIVPVDAVLEAREERAVDIIAARRLITVELLIDALRWCRGVTGVELADEVWTDQHALNVRLASLTPAERAQITAALADCDWVH